MKRIYKYLAVIFTMLLIVACAKEGLWNQNTEVPESQKGTIVGQLINDDNSQPLKGVKVLFERQTGKDQGNTFVDTVSTDSEGKFSYTVPFPNKVRLVVRDTGRYQADTAFVEVLEHKEYPIVMNSHPRFGASDINVKLLDDEEQPMEGIKIALLVRESSLESYSPVDTILTDAQGLVSFKDVAFPVRYKVVVAEKEVAYDLDAMEGFLQTKEHVNLTLHSRRKFGKSDVKLVAKYFYTNSIAANVEVAVSMKSILDETFSLPSTTTLDANGELNLPGVIYPVEIKIVSTGATAYPFSSTTVMVSESNVVHPILVNLFDSSPRYWDMTPSGLMGENTLVAFYDGVPVQEMEVDSKGNIYAVTTDNMLVRIPYDGAAHKVMVTGLSTPWGIAMQDDHTMYITENAGDHTIKKVVVDPVSDIATVTVFAGSGSGSKDGVGAAAQFNRPGDAVYDKSRNCLWVVEWSGARIRKVDLSTGTVSTLATGTGYGFGLGLTKDYKYLYIATHTSPAGIVKYDIDNKKMYTVRSGYSIRHLAVAPNNDVYFNINGGYQGKQYKITNEVLIEGSATNTSSTFETIASNGSWAGTNLPPIGYSGTPNIAIASANIDGSPNGMCYDAYRGRLYFSVSADKRLYYLKRSTVPN